MDAPTKTTLAIGAVAAAGCYMVKKYLSEPKPAPSADGYKMQVAPFDASAIASTETIATPGTLLLCVQNLAVSGANQVLLNLVEGHVWRGNIVLLSPSVGPFAKEFSDLGVAVQIGSLESLLQRVPDVRLAICNTIMTAHLVVSLAAGGIPSMWILHEVSPPP